MEKKHLLEVVAILLAAPLLQLALFLISGVTFQTHSHFAFLTGIPTLYVVMGAVWWLLRRRGQTLRDVGWDSESWGREALMGAVGGIGVMILIAVLSVAVGQVLPSAISREPRPQWAAFVYGFGLVTAFAPIEEIVWRGYAITELKKITGRRWIAWGASAVAFGAFHWWGGPALVVTTTVAGLAFTGIFRWRGTLLAAVSAHLVADLPLFLFMLFQVQPPQ